MEKYKAIVIHRHVGGWPAQGIKIRMWKNDEGFSETRGDNERKCIGREREGRGRGGGGEKERNIMNKRRRAEDNREGKKTRYWPILKRFYQEKLNFYLLKVPFPFLSGILSFLQLSGFLFTIMHSGNKLIKVSRSVVPEWRIGVRDGQCQIETLWSLNPISIWAFLFFLLFFSFFLFASAFRSLYRSQNQHLPSQIYLSSTR